MYIINPLNTITIIFQQKNNLVLEVNQQPIRPYTSQLMEILKTLNNKMVVAGIFFNLKKAFDCVNHQLLLFRLEFYEAKSNTKLWFTSYFSNRFQTVLIKKKIILTKMIFLHGKK